MHAFHACDISASHHSQAILYAASVRPLKLVQTRFDAMAAEVVEMANIFRICVRKAKKNATRKVHTFVDAYFCSLFT